MRNHSYENEFHLHDHFHANQSHFHFNGFARRLVLKLRQRATRKWPIGTLFPSEQSPVLKIIMIIILYSNTVYSIQMVFEKEDHEVIPI